MLVVGREMCRRKGRRRRAGEMTWGGGYQLRFILEFRGNVQWFVKTVLLLLKWGILVCHHGMSLWCAAICHCHMSLETGYLGI